jgi:two-component system OmpR family sensor kinase
MKKNFNKHSIFFTINTAFIIFTVIISISFFILYEISNKKEEFHLKRKAINISKNILRESYRNDFVLNTEFKEYLLQLNYVVLNSSNTQKLVSSVQHKQPIFTKRLKNNRLEIYSIDNKKFLLLITPVNIFAVEDKNKIESSFLWIVLTYFFIILLLFILYRLIIKKLEPLQQLQKNIQKLSKEEFDIDCSSSKKDEISILSNEFHQTALKLKTIKESRNIFIRNIMHELKTPITKGKLLSELEQTPKNKERLKSVFLRLEALIFEFASIEELISANKKLQTKEYFLEDLVDEAIDLLMIDPKFVSKQYKKDIKLHIDFRLFSIALKNLIDNGIKYASDNQVTITNTENKIIFTNQGEPLKYNLEQYYEPFFKGDNVKSNESFGLGLYIVHNILLAHDYNLDYTHKNGLNNFILSSY